MELKDIVPFLAGAFTTFLAFFLNQLWLDHRDKKLKYERVVSLLKAGIAEVQFNYGKLVAIDKQITDCLNDIQKKQLPFVTNFPSYTLLPEFLETLKKEFVEYTSTSELVPTIGNLHFELRHIQNKLALLLASLDTETKPDALIGNMNRLLSLVRKHQTTKQRSVK